MDEGIGFLAQSPAHRFGQIIGDMLEEILEPELRKFAQDRSLYLDKKGVRVDVRKGKKLSWEDKYGNLHDLDFVLERNADNSGRGKPVAFTEAAWRRYTKHSKNKVQEIQGAILPIAELFAWENPFLGAFLAGEFTSTSLAQLRSHGFAVAHLPYETVVSAFASVGIDARFDEDTPDSEFRRCVLEIEALSKKTRELIKETLVAKNRAEIDQFLTELRAKLDRLIDTISLTPLFGNTESFSAADVALKFLEDFEIGIACGTFQKWDVRLTYSNGDEVRGTFDKSEAAISFLKRLL